MSELYQIIQLVFSLEVAWFCVDLGMGTKIQANAYLREYHSLIELDASTSNAMNEKWILENRKHSDSLSSYDIEKVRQTILEHESTFRNQVLIIFIRIYEKLLKI